MGILKEMLSSKEIKYIALFGFILFIITTGLSIGGKTFLNVDQIYCRSYHPWKALHPEMSCSQEREADNIFESAFIARELDYLSHNPHQQSYTERTANGYPLASSYSSNPYSLTRFLNRFLPITTSVNFVTLTVLFTSFVIGYLIGRTLKFTPKYSLVFGYLSITASYVFLIEAWNLSMIGFGLVILGALQYYFYDRKYLFILLTFLGATGIVLSAFFQIYISVALSIALFGIVSLWTKNKKNLYILVNIIVIFLASALILNSFLIDHLSFLSVSNKIKSEATLAEFVKKKEYALDPMGWIGYEPIQINRKIVATLFGEEFGYQKYGSVTIGNWSPGPTFMVLFFIGAIALWQRKYRFYTMTAIFWLLYGSGYLNFLFSLLIGSPFKEQTSLQSSNLFFLIGAFAVVYALQGLSRNEIIISKNWRRFLWIFFGYLSIALPVLIFVRYQGYKVILIESICITISSLLFLLWMYFQKNADTSKQKLALFLLVISLILPSFGRLFLRANPGIISLQDSSLYYPKTKFGELVKQHPDIQRVALIQTPLSGRVQEQNGPTFLGLNTVTTYRNPMYKHYTDLYYYHRFIFQGSQNATTDFNKLKTTVAYLNNDLSVLKAPESKIILNEATKRFFLVTGVNAIMGSKDLEIKNKEWKKVIDENNLTLWKSTSSSPEFFLVHSEVVIADKIKQLEYMFYDPKWDPAQSVLLDEPILKEKDIIKKINTTEQITIKEKNDGYRLIEIKNISSPSILVLPVTFDKHWRATWDWEGNDHILKTFVSNGAFLGILIPEGSGMLEVLYDDRPKILNYFLSGAGVILLLSMVLYFRRSSLLVPE